LRLALSDKVGDEPGFLGVRDFVRNSGAAQLEIEKARNEIAIRNAKIVPPGVV